MKRLFKLNGIIKKTKEAADIFCIAATAEGAIAECSGFADDLHVLGSSDLGKGWNSQ